MMLDPTCISYMLLTAQDLLISAEHLPKARKTSSAQADKLTTRPPATPVRHIRRCVVGMQAWSEPVVFVAREGG